MTESLFKPPYYAVIFISQLSDDIEGYDDMAEQMLRLARTMPGFIGVESAREQTGITVSFWQDRDSIDHWRQHSQHKLAQKLGREKWYQSYQIHIAKVEQMNQHLRD